MRRRIILIIFLTMAGCGLLWYFCDDWFFDATTISVLFITFIFVSFWAIYELILFGSRFLLKKTQNKNIIEIIACLFLCVTLNFIVNSEIEAIENHSDIIISYIEKCVRSECDLTEGNVTYDPPFKFIRESNKNIFVLTYKHTSIKVYYKVSKKDGVVEITSTTGTIIKGPRVRWYSY